MTEGIEVDDLVTGTGTQKSTSGSSRQRAPSVEKPDESVVELLFNLVDNEEIGYEIEVFAFAEDAEADGRVISAELADELGLPEAVETFSFEDFFGIDMSEYDYFGNPPRKRDDEGNTEIPEEWREMTGNGQILADAKTALNGNYVEEIQERFASDEASVEDPEVMVAIRIGKANKHDDDLEQRKPAVFYIQETDTTPKRVAKARKDVGDLTESEYEEWLEAHGYED